MAAAAAAATEREGTAADVGRRAKQDLHGETGVG